MKKFIATALLVCSQAVFADEFPDYIDLHITSHHSRPTYVRGNTENPYNDKNLGLGVGWKTSHPNFSVETGAFKNSYYDPVVYFGGTIHSDRSKPLSLGFDMAVNYGYPSPFMVLPHARVNLGHINAKVGFLPGGVRLVTLSIGVTF